MKTRTDNIYVALAALALACFALSSAAQAQLPSPPPDGGYPNGNTAEGDEALFNVTTGANNTAVGHQALYSNTIGNENTATGASALYSNMSGNENTAMGLNALTSNNGDWNTAVGFDALASNTSGTDNTATGVEALYSNTNGTANTAIGEGALYSNQTGKNNTATGVTALFSNQDGSRNVAIGLDALDYNISGGHNVAVGNAGLDGNTSGSFNIVIGYTAGWNLTAGDNNIDIGNPGVASESNSIRIGSVVPSVVADGSTQAAHTATYIAGVYGSTIPRSAAVFIDANGHLGVKSSSARFKEAIKPMDKTSETILALKPVTFHYKKDIDPDGTPQFGLVAEEVEKVNRDLVARDEQGKPYTVRYEAVNAMLLNEFIKEHQKVQRLEAALAAVNERFKAQDAKIDKVNAKVELTKPAPQMVVNDQ